MGQLIGVIGSSHAPSIAAAFDAGHQSLPAWKPFFDAYTPVKVWLAEQRPDVLIVVYNDHLNSFQLDAYPTFAIGMGAQMPVADEGRGPRKLPMVPGNPTFAAHVAERLIDEEFDLTLCQRMALDHGVMSVLPLLCDPPWPMQVLPIAANVIVPPLPTPRRCWRLGQALARAVSAYAGDLRVVILATGGMSHQLHGKSFGFTNPTWDNHFLDLLDAEPERLAAASHSDFTRRGGEESVEMMLWLTMRAAMQVAEQGGAIVRRVQRYYYAPLLTGYGLIAYDLANAGL